jgi:hypothetical protein
VSREEEVFLRSVKDMVWYCETYLKVLDKQTLRLVPLRFKPAQRRLLLWMLEQYLAGRPVRVIILKARREGVSTAIQAFFFWLTSLRRHQIAVTLSHHDDTTRALHAISERYYQHLPSGRDNPASILRPKRRQTRRGTVMEFANPTKDQEELARQPGLESSMSTTTAKNAGAGQGANLVHCSEVGLWEGNQIDAKSVLDTLLQIVPLAPRTVICLESTARGVGNEFYARWKQAEASLAGGYDDFYPFFISWMEEPENRIEGATWETLDGLDEREERLRDRYKIGPEQLAWRRWAIRSQLGGDPDSFDQEYPESAEVAFLSSGRPFFPNEIVQQRIDELSIDAPEPICVGEIVEQEDMVTVVPKRRGRLTIWEAPKDDGEDYLISCDPSEGSGGDPQDIVVLARSSLREVACWHGHTDRGDLGDILFRLGWLYRANDETPALITAERQGGWGLTPLDVLRRRGYPRIHRRKEEGKKRSKRTIRLGFDMTETNRALVLDSLHEAILEDDLDSPNVEFYKECLVFEYGANGKPQATPKAHDDRVLSRAIAVYMWQTEPKRRRQRQQAPEVFSGLTGY